MKIALLLSGLTRSAKICSDSLDRYLLSKHDVDIYIHTWDVSNVSLDGSISETEETIEEIENIYNPKKIVSEPYFEKREFFQEKYSRYPKMDGTYDRSMAMFYKIQKCFEIASEGYDFYIRSRMDLMLNEEIPFDKINPECINIPSHQPRQTYISEGYAYSIPYDSYGINDTFSIGNYECMKNYSSIYNNLDALCMERGISYHPELITKANLEFTNTDINRFDLNYCLVRKPNR